MSKPQPTSSATGRKKAKNRRRRSSSRKGRQDFEIVVLDADETPKRADEHRRRLALRIDGVDADTLMLALDSARERKRQSAEWSDRFGLDAATVEDKLRRLALEVAADNQRRRDAQVAESEAARTGSNDDPADPDRVPGYCATKQGLLWVKRTGSGVDLVPLTNFVATIVANVIRDDGVETIRSLELEAKLCRAGAVWTRFAVPVARFSGMTWVIEALGPHAMVFPGFALKDHARAAIQQLSVEISARRVYTHTGWRRIDDRWLYLHGGGAIGPNGPVADAEVSLPSTLAAFELPPPPAGDDLRRAVRVSLELTDLAPLRISVPIIGAAYRSVIEKSDQTVSLVGETGVFKTELAALAQQHFGAGFHARNLPGSWSSTGNALETLAFSLKDALLVIDDFAPGGSAVDVSRYHRDADRVLRAQGNNSGRGRLRPDGEPRPTRFPRGLIVTTGEDVPRGESLRARQLIVEVKKGDIDPARLTASQTAGAEGLYAAAMAGFLRWAAARLDALRSELKAEVSRLRTTTKPTSHRRTVDIIAHLGFGFRTFVTFAVEIGAISPQDADELVTASREALLEQAAEQVGYLSAADPAHRFVELIQAAIVAGEANVAADSGGPPIDADRWGWQKVSVGQVGQDWRPRGDCIGWLAGSDLYLEPHAAHRVAQRMAGAAEGVAVGERTLRKRLEQGGWLASTDRERGKITVRRTLQGTRRDVLHFAADRLMPKEPAQSAQSATERTNGRGISPVGPESWAENGDACQEPAHKSGPNPANGTANGPLGPFGPVADGYDGPIAPVAAYTTTPPERGARPARDGG